MKKMLQSIIAASSSIARIFLKITLHENFMKQIYTIFVKKGKCYLTERAGDSLQDSIFSLDVFIKQ